MTFAVPDLSKRVMAGPVGVGTGRAIATAAVILGIAIFMLVAVTALARVLRRLAARRRAKVMAPLRPLLMELVTEDEQRVGAALERIAAFDRKRWRAVEPTLASLLGKVRGEIRTSLIRLFSERGVVDRVLRDLTRRGSIRRARAAAFLGDLRSREAVPTLCRLLSDRSTDVRNAAVQALGRIGDARATKPLLDTLTGDRRLPLHFVAYALKRLGSNAVPSLIAAVRDGEPIARAIAIEILGLMKAVAAADTVIAALRSDPSPEARIRAARALGRIGMPSGLPPLLDAVRADQPEVLRAVAATALGELGAADAVPALALLLGDPSHRVAGNASRALLLLGPVGEAALIRAAGLPGGQGNGQVNGWADGPGGARAVSERQILADSLAAHPSDRPDRRVARAREALAAARARAALAAAALDAQRRLGPGARRAAPRRRRAAARTSS